MSNIRQLADCETNDRRSWRSFHNDESGAVTTKFVVLTAMVVVLAVAAATSISSGALGLANNTAVIAYADHGEAFGDHRFYFHGQALYNEVIHIPLIVRLPGKRPPVKVVKERVALLDLAPTILSLMGLPAPEGFQGISLLPQMYGAKADPKRRIGAVLMPYPAWPKGQQALFLGPLLPRHESLTPTMPPAYPHPRTS